MQGKVQLFPPDGQLFSCLSNIFSKMFVGGLSWQTSEDSMKEYFAQFGPVVEALVMRDPATKHSRGFGFVTFAQAESVEKVSQAGLHNLDGKKIDPKVAFPKESTPKVCCVAGCVKIVLR